MSASEAKDPDPVKGLKTTRGREKAAIRYLQDAGRGADVPKCRVPPERVRGNLGTPGCWSWLGSWLEGQTTLMVPTCQCLGARLPNSHRHPHTLVLSLWAKDRK